MEGWRKRRVSKRKGEIGDVAPLDNPIRKYRSTGEMVFNTLKNAIVNGELKPGQRLIEQRLSERMKTSRIPVREAIKKLEQRGFVERLPVRGFIVSRISRAEVNETFGIRAALESYAASMATEYANAELIAELESNIESSYQAFEEEDMERLTELNAQFHEMIYEAARSPKLFRLINTFRDYMARYRKPLFNTRSGGLLSLKDHKKMVEAMKKGDGERVEKIVKRHIFRGKTYIMKKMESENED